MTTTSPLGLPAIRSRALADPGKPTGCCPHCGEVIAGNAFTCAAGGYCETPSRGDVAAADRFVLVGEVDRLEKEIADMRGRIEWTATHLTLLANKPAAPSAYANLCAVLTGSDVAARAAGDADEMGRRE